MSAALRAPGVRQDMRRSMHRVGRIPHTAISYVRGVTSTRCRIGCAAKHTPHWGDTLYLNSVCSRNYERQESDRTCGEACTMLGGYPIPKPCMPGDYEHPVSDRTYSEACTALGIYHTETPYVCGITSVKCRTGHTAKHVPCREDIPYRKLVCPRRYEHPVSDRTYSEACTMSGGYTMLELCMCSGLRTPRVRQGVRQICTALGVHHTGTSYDQGFTSTQCRTGCAAQHAPCLEDMPYRNAVCP